MAKLARLADLHAKLGINIPRDVPREEYLDHMTFRANRRPLFTEIFGPKCAKTNLRHPGSQGVLPRNSTRAS